MYSDTALIRGYVESLVGAGRTVVAIAHSYGGQVCSNALYDLGREGRASQGLKGGVSGLIYMCSYALHEGVAAMDKTKEFGNEDVIPLVFDIAEDETAIIRDARASFISPDIDDATAEAFLATLIRWNLKSVFQPTERAAWREIPVTYIHTRVDMTVPLHYQKNIVENVEKAGVKVQTFELNTGHCPFLADSKSLVDIVNKVVVG